MKKIIVGIESTFLSSEERVFYGTIQPAGFILFTRNIVSADQLTLLIISLREISANPEKLIISIDQEGGKVQRLKYPIDEFYHAPLHFGQMVGQGSLSEALALCYESNFKMASCLKRFGFNVNYTPVADLLHDDASSCIGNRSFGSSPSIVASFCKEVIRAHNDAGICPVVKHIPGHGRAKVDSHYALPVIDDSIESLESSDFYVFRELAKFCKEHNYNALGMNSHIIFTELDAVNPVTFSSAAVEFIKNDIGFTRLITDALEMHALTGSMEEKSTKAFASGFDFVLYSGYNMNDMTQIASSAQDIDPSCNDLSFLMGEAPNQDFSFFSRET